MEEVAETQAHLPVSLESDKHEEAEAMTEVNSFEEKESQKAAEPEPQPEPPGKLSDRMSTFPSNVHTLL